jgi:ABC-type glycerol-3-phosphate transport system substrate-binding protein
VDGWFLGINNRTRYVEASAQLLQHLASKEAMASVVKASGLPPARPALYKDSQILAAHRELEGTEKFFTQARGLPGVPQQQTLRSVLAREFRVLLEKKKTADEVTATLQAELQRWTKPPSDPPASSPPTAKREGSARSLATGN